MPPIPLPHPAALAALAALATLATGAASAVETGEHACEVRHLAGIEHGPDGEAFAGRIDPSGEGRAFSIAIERLDATAMAVACYVGLPDGLQLLCGEEDAPPLWRLTLRADGSSPLPAYAFHAPAPDGEVPRLWTVGTDWIRLSPGSGAKGLAFAMSWGALVALADGTTRTNLYLAMGDCARGE